jgi:hypothetical protein
VLHGGSEKLKHLHNALAADPGEELDEVDAEPAGPQSDDKYALDAQVLRRVALDVHERLLRKVL